MVTSSSLLLMVGISTIAIINIPVMFSGDSGGHFTIANTKSCEGTIYTSGIPTDRELNTTIILTVQASDRGSPSHTVCAYNYLN